MRTLIGTLALVALLTGASSCKTRKPRTEVLVDDQEAPVSAVVAANDSRVTAQLVRGFYDLESGAWRWTMPKFAIRFLVPAGAREKGAVLKADLVLPEVIFQSTGPVKLRATAGPQAFGERSLDRVGDHSVSFGLPAPALTTETITVEFSLDKALPPGAVDPRELGLIFSRAGLYLP